MTNPIYHMQLFVAIYWLAFELKQSEISKKKFWLKNHLFFYVCPWPECIFEVCCNFLFIVDSRKINHLCNSAKLYMAFSNKMMTSKWLQQKVYSPTFAWDLSRLPFSPIEVECLNLSGKQLCVHYKYKICRWAQCWVDYFSAICVIWIIRSFV